MTLDTRTARQAIFKKIREAQGRTAEPLEQARDAALQYIAAHDPGPRPSMPPDLVTHFEAQARRMSDTVQRLSAYADVPAAVASFLSTNGLPQTAIAWTTLSHLDWQAEGISIEFRPPNAKDLVGVTGCFCAIAETGTLMLLSGPDTYASASLLPETHIAIVPASRIVAAMEDAFALVRRERGELPRATNMISGPSRTGDIEQTIVLGAHGPYRVHVLILEHE